MGVGTVADAEGLDWRLFELKSKGLCCSQIVAVAAGLDATGDEDERLVKALRGLCIGMFERKNCGALTGGACALAMHIDGVLLTEACKDLVEWFGKEFGSIDCEELLGQDGVPMAVCVPLVKKTTEKCMELIAELADL